jgi:hypothetical protein
MSNINLEVETQPEDNYKEKQKDFKKINRLVRALPDNETKWNPAHKFPRNSDCPCGSQKKYKKCCLHKQPLAVTKDTADAFKTIVDYGRKNPDMKFVRPQPNQEQPKIETQDEKPHDDLKQSQTEQTGHTDRK